MIGLTMAIDGGVRTKHATVSRTGSHDLRTVRAGPTHDSGTFDEGSAGALLAVWAGDDGHDDLAVR